MEARLLQLYATVHYDISDWCEGGDRYEIERNWKVLNGPRGLPISKAHLANHPPNVIANHRNGAFHGKTHEKLVEFLSKLLDSQHWNGW